MDMKPILFILLALALGAVIAMAVRQDRKRKRLLRAWARSHGFAMNEGRCDGWEREYPALKIFERGRHRHSSLHLAGEVDGHRVHCLDYRFTTGSGKNRRVHRHGLVIVSTGTPVLPLRIRREHVFDRVGEFMGFDDIDFESAEFSRRFHVSGPDRKWAYDIIHPETMDYLMTTPSVAMEFGHGEIMVNRNGSLSGHGCQEDLAVARKLLELVPADVLAQLRGEST